MGSKNSADKNLHAGHRNRVRQNVLKNGFSQLEEHQLLELLLFYSIPRNDTNALAHKLLDEFGSLGEVFSADINMLRKVEGVGENTALMLSAIGEGHLRANKKVVKKRVFKTTDSVKELAVAALENEKIEKAVLFCFSKDYRLKRQVVICEGDEFSTSLETRKIVSNIMDSGSSFAVIAHNHPIGSNLPSGSDIDSTRAISVLLRNMGYLLADHVIVDSDGVAYSMHSDPRFSQLFF